MTGRALGAAALLALSASARESAPALPPAMDPVCAGAEAVSRPAAPAPENSRSLLWEIGRPGVPPSFVFGTMHSPVAGLPDEFTGLRALIRDSRAVALERDLEPSAQLAFGSRLALAEGSTLAGLLDPGLLARALDLASRQGLSPGTAEGLKVWALAWALERAPSGLLLDQALRDKARELGKPVVGLETFNELADTMDSIPPEAQAAVLRDAVCNFELNARVGRETAELYAAQDLAGVAVLAERAKPAEEGRAKPFFDKVLDERNARMAARAAALVERGGAFVAIGALHLPGPKGVLRLLEDTGYTASPVDMRALAREEGSEAVEPAALKRLLARAAAAADRGAAAPPPPEVVFVAEGRLKELACRGAEECPHAAFFDSGRTIYLHERLRRRLAWGDAAAKGVLLMQLVYYVQEQSGRYQAGSDCGIWRQRAVEAAAAHRSWMRGEGGLAMGSGGAPMPPQCSWGEEAR